MMQRNNIRLLKTCLAIVFSFSFFIQGSAQRAERISNEQGLSIATFDVDATPPTGTHMAYQPVLKTWDLGLRARGIVLLGAGQPIVLCAVDWLGIANESHDEFKRAIADAASTSPDRVAVHTLHQHDAPRSDFNTERILKDAGLEPRNFDGTFAREVIHRLADAVKESLESTQPVTHVGLGEAEVFKVASNRRILGKDGRVRAGRMSACKDPALRAEPEGVIDPEVSVVSFWNNERPVAILSYYATHPQSYYMTRVPNPDFPGVARFQRQLAVPGALHVHFTGAAGNIAAGKYNDGSKENRAVLADRLADGMKRAWDATLRQPITSKDIRWQVEAVRLPSGKELQPLLKGLDVKMKDTSFLLAKPWHKRATELAWLERSRQGKTIDVTCLTLGKARILHLPGELFVEYQLAAKKMAPDHFVAMAAYGDGGPGYIGTAIAYDQGGYEITVSNVGPESERILMKTIEKLLKDSDN
jgi:hypothetical protein